MKKPVKNNLLKNQVPVKSGLDAWNERLEEYLEPEGHNDTEADQLAKSFSEKQHIKYQASAPKSENG